MAKAIGQCQPDGSEKLTVTVNVPQSYYSNWLIKLCVNGKNCTPVKSNGPGPNVVTATVSGNGDNQFSQGYLEPTSGTEKDGTGWGSLPGC